MKIKILTFFAVLIGSFGMYQASAQVSSTLIRNVVSGTDDAEQRISTGALDLTSSDLEITTDGSNNQLIGIRFTNINLPQGAIIDSVFIQFANAGDKAPVNGSATFKGELTANSATFTSTVNDISTRSTTTASTVWAGSTDATWGTANPNFRGPLQRSPDLKTIATEIVSQGTWVSGNAMSFIITGSGVRNTRSFNGSSTLAPELTIYYTQTNYAPGVFPLTKGSIWKFLDNGSTLLPTWTNGSYNDSSWVFKNGKFGYGDSTVTAVSFGGNATDKHATTYFRNSFNMTNTAGFDTLIFKLLLDDGAIVYLNGTEVLRRNMPAGAVTKNTLALTNITGTAENDYTEIRIPNSLVNGLNTLAVEVHQFDTTATNDDMGFDLQLNAKRVAMPIVNFPIAKLSEWYYLDNGTNQDSAWRAPSFYEGSWNYGPAILGYGDASATTLSYGPNASDKYITTYFRKKVNIPSLAALTDSILFGIMRDDGAVVYVNGTAVFKSNMPDTVINYLTFSSTIVDGAAERTYNYYYIPKSVFVTGINTIAVEIHNRDGLSSDLTFEMEVKEDPRTLNLLSPTASQSIAAGTAYNINWYNIPGITKVKLEYSINNRATWNTIVNNFNAATRTYAWSVPNINASNSWVRISDSTNTYFDSVPVWIYPNPAPFNPCVDSLHIGCFTSVSQTRNQLLSLPPSHRFQQIARQGETHSLGGTVGGNLDFTGFVSFNGSSKKGALGVNEENTPGGVSVFYLTYKDSTGIWQRDSSGKVNLSATGLVQSTRNCSGGITPWGTIITSEESYNTGDVNADGYTDVGWQVEYNPWTRQVRDYNTDGTKDKLWSMGRMSHENVVLKNDSLTAYYGEDGGSSGVFKFVASQKMKLDTGTLYVLQRNGASGTWILVPNTTQAERNTVSSVVAGLGGTNFNGVEDVEINPVNGMIYFTSKNNSRIYRFQDDGTTVSNFEEYVGNAAVNYTMNIAGGATQSVNWGSGIDNLSFDNMGNLWAQQDGGNGHLWVIRPDHTPFAPKVDLFATTPSGSESGGLTFSPDYRFGFFSMMGASGTNSATLVDAANNSIVFNQSNTVVIANKYRLGTLAALPVEFAEFNARRNGKNNVLLNWATASETNNAYFEIQRSTDGKNFESINKVNGAGNSNILHSYTYEDANLQPRVYYYRLKQVDFNGAYAYSHTRTVNLTTENELSLNQVYPNPFSNELNISIDALKTEMVQLKLVDMNGAEVFVQSFQLNTGSNILSSNVAHLPSGIYIAQISTATEIFTYKLVK
ncbi:MAG: alkaline phosphatase PhoX [Bacteroidota bacterium]